MHFRMSFLRLSTSQPRESGGIVKMYNATDLGSLHPAPAPVRHSDFACRRHKLPDYTCFGSNAPEEPARGQSKLSELAQETTQFNGTATSSLLTFALQPIRSLPQCLPCEKNQATYLLYGVENSQGWWIPVCTATPTALASPVEEAALRTKW